jgi:exopolyphosphatase/guanosine-5'-triphosphate,3'-diphosphate pyrophosphatase
MTVVVISMVQWDKRQEYSRENMTLIQTSNELSESVVAIDLGSNSFHLLVATKDGSGGLVAINKKAKKVQLALNMVDQRLSIEAIDRGLECLRGFAEYTKSIPSSRVAIIGTQALRQALNSDDFIIPASRILGHSIEIVSGEKEAVLAYYGVATSCSEKADQDLERLVVDIGGGSTELTVGKGQKIRSACSVAVGCVTGLQYFPLGEINTVNIDTAKKAAVEQFSIAAAQIKNNWQLVLGCSGTLLAVEQVLIQQGWVKQGISRSGLQKLYLALLEFDCIDEVTFQGLDEARRSIFATGVAITLALFDVFNIDSMRLSNGGLREGIAWSLLQVS